MTETLKIAPTRPANPSGLQRGADGYYTIELKRGVDTPTGQGVIVALLKLNEIDANLSQDQIDRYTLSIDEIGDQDTNSITMPTNGIVVTMTSISSFADRERMLVTLAPVESHNLYTLHLDVLAAAQLIIPRDNQMFVNHRPGRKYYVTIDFDPKTEEVPQTATEQLQPVEPAAAETASVDSNEPTLSEALAATVEVPEPPMAAGDSADYDSSTDQMDTPDAVEAAPTNNSVETENVGRSE